MKRASIMMATRNRSAQLAVALESIKVKNYQNVEIIVVDDASSDDTATVLRDYGDGLRSVRIDRPGGYRPNPSAVLNVGHLVAKSDIVIEQGAEVCHLTDCVTPLLKVCQPGIVALARVHNGSIEEMEAVQKDIITGHYDFPDDFKPDRCETVGTKLKGPIVGRSRTVLYCGRERPAPFLFLGAIHQDDFAVVGRYNETIARGNDEDLANRLQARGVRFCFVGRAIGFHLKHGKS